MSTAWQKSSWVVLTSFLLKGWDSQGLALGGCWGWLQLEAQEVGRRKQSKSDPEAVRLLEAHWSRESDFLLLCPDLYNSNNNSPLRCRWVRKCMWNVRQGFGISWQPYGCWGEWESLVTALSKGSWGKGQPGPQSTAPVSEGGGGFWEHRQPDTYLSSISPMPRLGQVSQLPCASISLFVTWG